MTRQELEDMIRKAHANTVPGRDSPDCALKIYFYPLASALFTGEEFDGFVEDDEIHVHRSESKFVVTDTGRRLGAIVKAMDFKELYLSVIVYGMVVGTDYIDICYDIDKDGQVQTSTFKKSG